MYHSLLPPFTAETAAAKVRATEDTWNTRCPEIVSKAVAANSHWQNQNSNLYGRADITCFLKRKWNSQLHYRLIRELWAHNDNRICVRCIYEWRTIHNHWFRSFGIETLEFDGDGLMTTRIASINHCEISEDDRLVHWPFGTRPANHPAISELDL